MQYTKNIHPIQVCASGLNIYFHLHSESVYSIHEHQVFIPHAQRKQGNVIGVGVHMYITEKPFTSK